MKHFLLPACAALTVVLTACTSESKSTPSSGTAASSSSVQLATYKLKIDGMT